jgi:hypothetical protein
MSDFKALLKNFSELDGTVFFKKMSNGVDFFYRLSFFTSDKRFTLFADAKVSMMKVEEFNGLEISLSSWKEIDLYASLLKECLLIAVGFHQIIFAAKFYGSGEYTPKDKMKAEELIKEFNEYSQEFNITLDI